MSAEVIAKCVAQMGALNAAEPVSDGCAVKGQPVNGQLKNSFDK